MPKLPITAQLYEIGYNIAKPHWNKGYTTEAARAFVDFAFANLGLSRIFGEHAKINPASGKAMGHLGFGYQKDSEFPRLDGAMVFESREYLLKPNIMIDLMDSFNSLQTTELGAERIRRNLALQDGEDAVLYCKEAVKQADLIIRQGKNWYAYRKGIVVIINARSNTIITAKPIKAKVRVMKESDFSCLPEFLYQAIFIPKGVDPPSRSVVHKPEIFIYIKNFGAQRGDFGVVAEQNGQIVGAAWTRAIDAYGHVDSDTPELAIAVLPEFRGYGIGTKLMKKLFTVLCKQGYSQTSLSVQKTNPASRFYQRLGYKAISENDEDFIMIKDLV